MPAPLAPRRLSFLADDLASASRALARIDGPGELRESVAALARIIGAASAAAATLERRCSAQAIRAADDAEYRRQLDALTRGLADAAAVLAGVADDLEGVAAIDAPP